MDVAAPVTADALKSARASATALRDWIVERALPLWSTIGFDAQRGVFQERLDWSGRPVETVPRRAMVQARQIYVFAHAAHLGWFPEGGRLAEIAMSSLLQKFREAGGGSGGFAFSVSTEGRVVSTARDAYAHAFILFAIAWLYRLNGDPRLIGHADETIAFIDAALEDRAHGGLYDQSPVHDRNKRQNPHMHLLEAYLALEGGAPGRGYGERAKSLVDLFKTHLFREDPGVLLEYFAEDWSAHPDPLKRGVFEPGHHFEWVWLLAEYEKLTGEDLRRWILPLDRIARRNGLAEDGMIFDEVDSEMRVLKRSHRIWPHTEAAKAAVARWEMGDDASPRFAAAMIDALRTGFLDRPFVGGWTDHISADGSPLVDYAPASSLYHLFLATAETSRAFPRSPPAEPQES
ncbi:AGE family epimerase/isomerase [Methylocella tundrae]|uniref:Mannose-6-phosphate isomerase n=1 Tax=Methylocella tundrae TaxID=227605 RepID=A0A4U8YZ71_METTU|nr:AGE family epimerase/isomerase [Methylocella tundrae]WPP05770.1 AGE family epimerase/isomerase [Methylocella tundrae]VFU08270.1 Mannose-6-phosphate isomerase [Methylocella tundrae]